MYNLPLPKKVIRETILFIILSFAILFTYFILCMKQEPNPQIDSPITL